jgi:hypothetical protein
MGNRIVVQIVLVISGQYAVVATQTGHGNAGGWIAGSSIHGSAGIRNKRDRAYLPVPERSAAELGCSVRIMRHMAELTRLLRE